MLLFEHSFIIVAVLDKQKQNIGKHRNKVNNKQKEIEFKIILCKIRN